MNFKRFFYLEFTRVVCLLIHSTTCTINRTNTTYKVFTSIVQHVEFIYLELFIYMELFHRTLFSLFSINVVYYGNTGQNIVVVFLVSRLNYNMRQLEIFHSNTYEIKHVYKINLCQYLINTLQIFGSTT